MAKTREKLKPKPLPTKKQVAKWEQQKKQQRLILIIGIVFIALVLGGAIFGYYSSEIKPFHEAALKVNDTVFDMDYYLKIFRIYASGQQQTSLPFLVNYVTENLENVELLSQGSRELKISVSDEEVAQELKRLNIPDERVYRDVIKSQLLQKKVLSDYFLPQIPLAADQVHVQAMLLESEKAARDMKVKLGSGSEFTALVKEFSLDTDAQKNSGDFGWNPKGFIQNTPLEEAVFSIEPGKVSQPVFDGEMTKNVGYWLIKVLDKNAEQGSQISAILLGSQEEAEQVKTKLKAGDDFAALAKTYSQHEASKEKGGDLGRLKPGAMVDAFDKVAFTLEIGVVSEPVRDASVVTKGGYWLAKVVEKESNRKLEDKAREQLAGKAMDDWFKNFKAKSKIENYLDESKTAWALAQLSKTLVSSSGTKSR